MKGDELQRVEPSEGCRGRRAATGNSRGRSIIVLTTTWRSRCSPNLARGGPWAFYQPLPPPDSVSTSARGIQERAAVQTNDEVGTLPPTSSDGVKPQTSCEVQTQGAFIEEVVQLPRSGRVLDASIVIVKPTPLSRTSSAQTARLSRA